MISRRYSYCMKQQERGLRKETTTGLIHIIYYHIQCPSIVKALSKSLDIELIGSQSRVLLVKPPHRCLTTAARTCPWEHNDTEHILRLGVLRVCLDSMQRWLCCLCLSNHLTPFTSRTWRFG